VALNYGVPCAYCTDSHSLFHSVHGRDSLRRKHYLVTDDVDPSWMQVLPDNRIKPLYTLLLRTKGKVERSYGWLQDRLIDTCAIENIKTIDAAR